MQNQSLEKVEKKHGGARKGAGMPKGKKTAKTVAKELELQYIRDRVAASKESLMNAQITLATGVSYLYRIDKDSKGRDKKPELVKSQWEIESYLSGEADPESYYYITTEKPENNALDSLFDRTIGKPKTVNEITGKDGKDLIPDTSERAKQLLDAILNKSGRTSTD